MRMLLEHGKSTLSVAWATIYRHSSTRFFLCTVSICLVQQTCFIMQLCFPSPSTHRSAIDHNTAVRMQALPRNHTAILTRQENKASRNLGRLRRPTHRRSAELILRLLRHRRGDEGRPDGAGADGVDADAVGDLLVVQAAGEGHDGAFGAGVVEQVGPADVRVDGGAVADGVAALHVLEGVFGDVEEGVDVRVEGLEPLLSAGFGVSVDGVRWIFGGGGGGFACSERSLIVGITF